MKNLFTKLLLNTDQALPRKISKWRSILLRNNISLLPRLLKCGTKLFQLYEDLLSVVQANVNRLLIISANKNSTSTIGTLTLCKNYMAEATPSTKISVSKTCLCLKVFIAPTDKVASNMHYSASEIGSLRES